VCHVELRVEVVMIFLCFVTLKIIIKRLLSCVPRASRHNNTGVLLGVYSNTEYNNIYTRFYCTNIFLLSTVQYCIVVDRRPSCVSLSFITTRHCMSKVES
jgi:hypothetical protein